VEKEQAVEERAAKKQVAKIKKKLRIGDISRNRGEQLAHIDTEDLMPLPFGVGADDQIASMTEEQKASYECSLDGTSALSIPKPKNKAEEDELALKSRIFSLYSS